MFSAPKSCAAAIPDISELGIFGLRIEDNATHAGIWIKPNGSVWVTSSAAGDFENALMVKADGTSLVDLGGQRISATDASQQIQYMNQFEDRTLQIDVEGFKMNIR